MKYFIITGEKSGDFHAAGLIKALLIKDPMANVVAYAGDHSQAAGARLIAHYADYSVMGTWEVISKFFHLLRVFRKCKKDILNEKPDRLILVDFSGFNLRMTRFAKHQKIHVTYYIAPKTWTWNNKRNKVISQNVDLLLTIFPFEPAYFKQHGITAYYVGNPSMEYIKHRQFTKLPKSEKIVVLPGSRAQEIKKIIPVLQQVFVHHPELKFIVSKVSHISPSFYTPIDQLENVEISEKEGVELLQNAQAAIITSGTASLEAAILNVPQVVVYKTNYLTFLLASQFLKVRFISLVNILLGRGLVKELIQNECNPENISKELVSLQTEEERQKKISEGYSEINDLLGQQVASKEAADLILCGS